MTDFSPVYDVENPPLPARESRVSDFWALLKPRVMSLVVFSGFAGMWVAPGFSETHPFLIFISIITLALGAGAAGAINMWYDRDIDLVMKRTKNRPVPAGRVEPSEALTFALFMTVAAVLTMGVALNWVAAGILAFATFFYAVIYTMWLKRSTPQNIVIGGAAGAFPPMIGWACITGDVTLMPLLLFAIIFLWTPPHFWALSLFACEDYRKAGVPMLPVVAGEAATKKQMLLYTLLLLPVTLAPFMLGMTGWMYGISALILSSFFVFTALRVLQDQTHKSARLMFGYSVFYLFALFLALMIDAA
ncbi:MAG: heme o synthase [Alphaproteobacteria bacterium]|nr:heme o synthase [Alphaproteobacteria bacterium]